MPFFIGKFFGDINVKAMEGLISANIYRRIEYYDYQSICFGESEEEEGDGTSGGNIFGTVRFLVKLLNVASNNNNS